MNALILDDDDIFVALISQMVQRDFAGVRIFSAPCCGKGLAILRSEDFDILILDHKLIGATGLECMPEIRDGFPALPVLVMTDQYCRESMIDEYITAGADVFAIKDLWKQSLHTSINTAIARRRNILKIEAATKARIAELETLLADKKGNND